ncbi:hypothetical protein H0H93_004765 [Arthromyces matolae]|nr:hypothetical protein H0H93_004765 [Arthromyces matolae]
MIRILPERTAYYSRSLAPSENEHRAMQIQVTEKLVDDPWSLITEQQNVIFPRLLPPVFDILHKHSAERSSESLIEKPQAFDATDLEPIRSEIWRTNYRLSQSQKETAEDQLENAYYDSNTVRKEIEELSSERNLVQLNINRLLAQLDTLDQELQSLKKKRLIRDEKVDLCIALLSPARLLPAEILLEIFHYCEPPKKKLPKSLLIPYTLGHVCSAWRQTALRLPSLWNTRYLEFGRTDEGLSLTVNNNDLVMTRYAVQAALRAAFIFRESLTSLHVYVEDLDCLFNLPSTTFPVLETLGLDGTLPYGDYLSRSRVFAGATKLRKLVLDIEADNLFKEGELVDDFPWPWSQITHLEIRRRVHLRFIPHILIKLVNLEYAYIVLEDALAERGIPDESSTSDSPVTFENLKELVLESSTLSSKRLSTLFSLISLPALSKFSLRSKFCDSGIGKVSIYSAVAPSLENLQSLTLTPIYLDKEEGRSLLRMCPRLSRLSIFLGPPSHDFRVARTPALLNEVMPGFFEGPSHPHSLSLLDVLPRLISFKVTLICADLPHFQVVVKSLKSLYLSSIPPAQDLRLESLSLAIYTDGQKSSLRETTVQPVLQELQDQLLELLKAREGDSKIQCHFGFRK